MKNLHLAVEPGRTYGGPLSLLLRRRLPAYAFCTSRRPQPHRPAFPHPAVKPRHAALRGGAGWGSSAAASSMLVHGLPPWRRDDRPANGAALKKAHTRDDGPANGAAPHLGALPQSHGSPRRPPEQQLAPARLAGPSCTAPPASPTVAAAARPRAPRRPELEVAPAHLAAGGGVTRG